MKVAEISELHPSDFTVEDGKVRVLKAYNWYLVYGRICFRQRIYDY